EALHSSAFDRADMHEDILAAVIWLDESVALLAIEPLHGSLRHLALLSSGRFVARSRAYAAGFVRDLVESRQSDAACAARPSRSAESSINSIWCITVWAARRLFVSEVTLASNLLVRFDTFASRCCRGKLNLVRGGLSSWRHSRQTGRPGRWGRLVVVGKL